MAHYAVRTRIDDSVTGFASYEGRPELAEVQSGPPSETKADEGEHR
jgi:hypothetical protein